MTGAKIFLFSNILKINKTETELQKYFAYEQRTLTRLTLRQQQQIARTNDPLSFNPLLRQAALNVCPLNL